MPRCEIEQVPNVEQGPFVGALLRLVHQEARLRVLKILDARGLGDIGTTYFALFQYPGTDGMRPSDVARRLGVSKQALNHMVGQLERLGYLERHPEPGGRHTTLRYTERGWQVLQTAIETMIDLEAEWQGLLGERRFAEFKGTLKMLAGLAG